MMQPTTGSVKGSVSSILVKPWAATNGKRAAIQKKGRCLAIKEISRTQAVKDYFLLRLGVNFENVWIPKCRIPTKI